MRRIGIIIMCLAFIGALAVASSASAEEVTPFSVLCQENRICTYGTTEFREEVISFECSSSGKKGLGGNLLSALNKCGNKTDWLRENGTVVACMNPGGERPHPGPFNEVFIAEQYGAFC